MSENGGKYDVNHEMRPVEEDQNLFSNPDEKRVFFAALDSFRYGFANFCIFAVDCLSRTDSSYQNSQIEGHHGQCCKIVSSLFISSFTSNAKILSIAYIAGLLISM